MSTAYPLLDFDKRCVEPRKRMFEGTGPRWVVHRFPIKDGLPLRVVMTAWRDDLAAQAARPSFLERMLAAKGSPVVTVDI